MYCIDLSGRIKICRNSLRECRSPVQFLSNSRRMLLKYSNDSYIRAAIVHESTLCFMYYSLFPNL